ncbi:MAG: NUDIX hydrolase [Methanotrichaceae archaeon]|nr:NUDIX hydrolase [Methanotrichaceae archaeon]
MKSLRTPLLAVDAVIFIEKGIVLIERKNPPFKGYYALPGGFVEVGETTVEAVCREVKEETGLEIEVVGLIDAYSDPKRDPRGHVVSISYLAIGHGNLANGSDAQSVKIFEPERLPELAFDHKIIICDAMKLKSRYSEDQIKV